MDNKNSTNFDTRPIGVLDSGVGGLTVLSKLMNCLPNENYIYFGDTKNLPYGNKSCAQLFILVRSILNFFKTKNVKAVVLGCNTTAAVVYEMIKNEYDFPIYPIIQDACKKINPQNFSKIGVFATQVTVNSLMYTKSLKAINPQIEVLEIACPNWVGFVEQSELNTNKCILNIGAYVKEMLEFKPEKIILGCTHYPYLTPVLQKFAPKNMFLNPAQAFAEYIREDLATKKLLNNTKNPSREFFVSANAQNFLSAAQLFFELDVLPTLVNLDKNSINNVLI